MTKGDLKFFLMFILMALPPVLISVLAFKYDSENLANYVCAWQSFIIICFGSHMVIDAYISD